MTRVDRFRPDVMSAVTVLRGSGYDQREIAEYIGISQQTVSRYLGELERRARESDPGQVVEEALPAWKLFWRKSK